ncbi:VOC family protein [Stenotrophomonas mori]|uniref:VOC family protein n=1 Tax=Stenotrophomonas mori TaxID=2871096 RepID=A0ABT0SI25_9GAMM|nr:VOC family protein [Stenotrophomonas mori]MCL7714650.1 VOC family protein [Stenotrophomonas mori]
MFSHVMVGSNDLERSRRFYDSVLGLLGAGAPFRMQKPDGQTALFYRNRDCLFAVTQPKDGAPATVANGATIGFSCGSPEQVRQFHALALANGGTAIEDPPGPRGSPAGDLYMAYVRDPDGNKLCALHRLPADAGT